MSNEVESVGLESEVIFITMMKSIRDAQGISRVDFAERMVRAGHTTWRESTVPKVENGSRSVKLSEAVSIAGILQVNLSALLSGSTPDEFGQLVVAIQNLATASGALLSARTRFETRQARLRNLFESMGYTSSDDVAAKLGSRLNAKQRLALSLVEIDPNAIGDADHQATALAHHLRNET